MGIFLAAALAVLFLFLSDPFMLWMPPLAATLSLCAAAVVIAIFMGFVVNERAADEREAIHRMNGGRVAYLSGLAILTIAFVVQGFLHKIDPWISAAILVMVVSKLAARIYFERYK